MLQNSGRFGEWHMPESMLIATPLENCGLFAGAGDVIVAMDCGSLIAFMKDVNVSVVSKWANAE